MGFETGLLGHFAATCSSNLQGNVKESTQCQMKSETMWQNCHDFVPSHNHMSGDRMEIHGFHFPPGNDLQMVVFAGHIYLKLLGFTMMYICYYWAIQLS
jgi:hypothetical protein